MFSFFKKKPFVNPYLKHKPVIIHNNLFHLLPTKVYIFSAKHSNVKEFKLVDPKHIVDNQSISELRFYTDSILIPYKKLNDVIIQGANNKAGYCREFEMSDVDKLFDLIERGNNSSIMRHYSRMYYYATMLLYAPYSVDFEISIGDRHYATTISTIIINNKNFGVNFIINKKDKSTFICGDKEDTLTTRTKLYYFIEEYLVRTLLELDKINITYQQNRVLTNSLNLVKKHEDPVVIPSKNIITDIDIDAYYKEIKSIIYK